MLTICFPHPEWPAMKNPTSVVDVEGFLRTVGKRVLDLKPFGLDYLIIKSKVKNSTILHLVSSYCPHQGLPLEPIIREDHITCPYHGCKFYCPEEDSPLHLGRKLKILKTLEVIDGKVSI